MDVLFVCTGNICRSPMAEAILRHRLAAAGAGADVRVHSAGLVTDGEPASRHGVDLLAGRGVDLAAHRSRRLTAEMVRAADLVLGMAREHIREAVVLVPEAFSKSFTIKELVRRGEQVGPRAPGQPVDEWLEKVHVGRAPAALMGRSPADDVADPIGQGPDAYRRTGDELDDLVSRLVDLVWRGR